MSAVFDAAIAVGTALGELLRVALADEVRGEAPAEVDDVGDDVAPQV